MGQWVGSGEGTHYDLLWDLEPYLSDRSAPLALLLVLLRLSYCLDLWGALEPTFAPVLAWVCLALPAMKRLDSKVTIGNQTCYTFNASTPWSSVKSQSSSLPSLK